MDKISFISFLIVSIPEEFLFAVTTAFLVGKKDILKSKSGWIRILIATLLTAVFADILRSNVDNMVVIILSNLVFFTVTYVMVLKLNKTEAAVGFMLVWLFQLVVEIADAVIVMNVTHIGLAQIYQSDMIRFLHSLPARLIQLSTVLMLYKLPFALNLRDIKFTQKVKINYSIAYLCVILAIINIGFLFKKYFIENSIFQSVREPILWINLVLIVTMIFTIIKLLDGIRHERREQIIKLAYVKDLLVECNGDIIEANKRIDEMIKRIGGKLK